MRREPRCDMKWPRAVLHGKGLRKMVSPQSPKLTIIYKRTSNYPYFHLLEKLLKFQRSLARPNFLTNVGNFSPM